MISFVLVPSRTGGCNIANFCPNPFNQKVLLSLGILLQSLDGVMHWAMRGGKPPLHSQWTSVLLGGSLRCSHAASNRHLQEKEVWFCSYSMLLLLALHHSWTLN